MASSQSSVASEESPVISQRLPRIRATPRDTMMSAASARRCIVAHAELPPARCLASRPHLQSRDSTTRRDPSAWIHRPQIAALERRRLDPQQHCRGMRSGIAKGVGQISRYQHQIRLRSRISAAGGARHRPYRLRYVAGSDARSDRDSEDAIHVPARSPQSGPGRGGRKEKGHSGSPETSTPPRRPRRFGAGLNGPEDTDD